MKNYFREQLQRVKRLKIYFRKCSAALVAASIFLQFPLFPQNDSAKAVAETVATPSAPQIGCLTSITISNSVFSGTSYALPSSTSDPSVSAFVSYLSGKGSSADPIKITTEEQFKAFAFLANNTATANQFENKHIKLETDIDLGGGGLTCSEPDKTANYLINVSGSATNAWLPIGQNATPFKGHFDGGGHTISNMVVAVNNALTYSRAGFFGMISGGTVENLNIGGTSMVIGKSTVGYVFVGGVVGCIEGPNSKIQNCGSTCTIITQSPYIEGATQSKAGGVLGTWEKSGALTLDGCWHEGSVYSNSEAGGVAGSLHEGGTAVKISNCYHTGTVATIGKKAGGIVSGFCYLNSCEIDRCTASGTVTGAQTGGIIGGAGDIPGNPDTSGWEIKNDHKVYIGGVQQNIPLPTSSTHFHITNCSFEGDVKGSGQTGGLIAGFGGYLKGDTNKPSVKFDNCTVAGNVVGSAQTGGIVAGFGLDASTTQNSKVVISGCTVTGMVYGGGRTGGLLASFGGIVKEGLSVTACAVNGDVLGGQTAGIATAETAGLIYGFYTEGGVTVDGCTCIGGVYTGRANTSGKLGGILGGFYADKSVSILNSRFEGIAKMDGGNNLEAGGMIAEFGTGSSTNLLDGVYRKNLL